MSQERRTATANDVAMVIARREGLVLNEETGELACWNCGRPGAVLPQLRCRSCIKTPRYEKPPPAADPWIAWADMLRDGRLTVSRAEQILDRAARRWDATEARLSPLRMLFERRFGEPKAAVG